jgi:hypothetical protein
VTAKRLRRGLLVGGLALAACLPAETAAAHPFGPPLTADLRADGSTVTVTWAAAEDDWLNLGQHVGAFTSVDDGAGGSGDMVTGEELLARSEAVRAYLGQHIAVRQQGRDCAAEEIRLERVLADGAELAFACPAPVDDVEIEVSALTDVNEAYRTVVTAPDGSRPGRTMLTAATPSRDFVLTTSPDSSGAAPGVGAVAIAALLVLALAGAAAGVALRLRSSRRRTTS